MIAAEQHAQQHRAEDEKVSGPAVRKLLKHPELLQPNEFLRLAPGYSSDLQLAERREARYGLDRHISRSAYFDLFARKSRLQKIQRKKTCAELAAEVDAWLLARAAETKADKEKKAREEAEKTQAAERREALRAAFNLDEHQLGVTIELLPELRLLFKPNDNGTGWILSVWDSLTGPVTTEQVRALAIAHACTRVPCSDCGHPQSHHEKTGPCWSCVGTGKGCLTECDSGENRE